MSDEMALREKYPLHPNKIYKKVLENASFLVIASFILIFFSFISPMFLACLPIAIVAVLGIYWWSKEYYRVYFYDLSERGLEIKKGVFFPNSITIPVEKISDIYVDQDLFDRALSLFDLHFSSASTTSGTHAHIDGMDKQTTDSLKAFLMGEFRGEQAPSAQPMGAKAPEAQAPSEIATFKPAPKGYWVELAGALFSLLFVIFYLATSISDSEIFLTLLPISVLGFITLSFPVAFYIKKEYESRIYKVRQDGLWIRKGWLTPSETLLLYKNIQDTDVSQDVLSRLFGFYNVSIKSMSVLSAMGARLTFLTDDDANHLQQLVREQIEKPSIAQKPALGATARQAQAAPIKYAGESLAKPFKNQFVMGRIAGSLPIMLLLIVPSLLALLLSAVFPSAFTAIAVFAGIFILLAIGIAVLSVITALIDDYTYSYSISENGLSIELGLLARYKKVIRFEKIQDIRLHCGFVESFFGLANMEIETGSKDIVESGKGSGAAMNMATLTESIPCLKLQDAYALRSKLMGICGITYPSSQQPLRNTVPLSEKKPLKKTVAYVSIFTFQALLVGILIALFGQSYLPYLGIGIALLALLNMTLIAFIIYSYEQVYLHKYFYDADSDSLVIRKGVFGWSEIVVPFRNIQSIYIDQDWYDVYFDTWDVWITTVTATSGPMAHIDGTGRADAEKLARLLVDRVEKARKK